MFINPYLQERYSRILEHLVKIDGVISETLGLTSDAQDVKTSGEDSPATPDECGRLETTEEILDQTDYEMYEMNGGIPEMNGEIPEWTGEMTGKNSEMTDENSEISDGNNEMDEENSDVLEMNSDIIETDREMSDHDSGSRAVSEEDLAYEGPEIVIDAEVEAGTEEKNETEENAK